MSEDVLAPSKDYAVRVFFFTNDPDSFIEEGYDSLRVERRKDCHSAWKEVSKEECFLELASGKYNYSFLDQHARIGMEYRAVLQNSVVPGTPPDVPQPVQQGVDVSYENVMTIRELKEIYLWGEDSAFITEEGEFQPDYTFAHAIRYGIKKVENNLDVKLTPTLTEEAHDWIPESWGKGYVSLVLDEYPVLEIKRLRLQLPGATPYDYPAAWLKLNKNTGQLRVVPSSVDNLPTSSIVPGSRGYVPAALEVQYFAGFREVPADLKELVGKEAAFGPLNVGGDLVGGAGLAGTSLSLDGLSQSVTTTNSSTNAGFGARLIQYEKELRSSYKILRPYYKGLKLNVA